MVVNKTYILNITVNKNLGLYVGKLGNIEFKKGHYFYIGQAKRGFRARLKRHLSRDKKIFWHIDYLLSANNVQIDEIWSSADREECQTARSFYCHGYDFMPKFGSSDCRCFRHLFFTKDISSAGQFLKKEKFRKIGGRYANKSFI